VAAYAATRRRPPSFWRRHQSPANSAQTTPMPRPLITSILMPAS
jgi:hypothetical protein